MRSFFLSRNKKEFFVKKEVFVVGSTGFALFAMFFGSGNIVFPIGVGVASEGHYVMASLGVLCTCVIFPLLGMLGMTLYNGSIQDFFGAFGKKGVFLFSALALALMGPFGVLARCLTVIHGAFQMILPEVSLPLTSLWMCIAIYFLAANKNKIVTLLGSLLTPVLLLALGSIVFAALNQGAFPAPLSSSGWISFKEGFFTGYQTMDLVASFFFSGFVIQHLYQAKNEEASLKLFVKASLVGAGLLYVVYFALVFLGWKYAPLLVDVAPQEMFGRIALETLGSFAAPMVCLAVIFACLTTAIALASLFGEFLRKDIAREKISHSASLLITLGIAFLVSTLEFSGIAQFLGPILEAIYPALITLTLGNIASKLSGVRFSHWPFTATLLAKLCWI
jgi:LIVCS family branched-chain amino acid:cation transporter